jgi:predicted helicase
MFENDGARDKPQIVNEGQEMFPENNQRVVRQRNNDIRVIIGNPPYSSGQTSENDGNKNLKYPQLDDRIRKTYAEYSTATLKIVSMTPIFGRSVGLVTESRIAVWFVL